MYNQNAMKKKTVSAKDKTSKRDYLTILMENMAGDIKAIAEGQVALREEMDRRFTYAEEQLNDFKSETRANFKLVFERMEKFGK